MMFRGTKFCPHCGASASSAVVGATTADVCPRCERALVSVAVGAFIVEQCPGCGGLWLAAEIFDRICADAESRSAAAALALPPAVDDRRPVAYLRYPSCRQPMGRMNYARRSGIITDVCRPHGVWCDRDDLRHIVEFIEAGGLVRARELEKERLDAARRALEFQKRTAPDSLTGKPRDDDDSPVLW
jgi:Zn-finger nucleic acid-binding protein